MCRAGGMAGEKGRAGGGLLCRQLVPVFSSAAGGWRSSPVSDNLRARFLIGKEAPIQPFLRVGVHHSSPRFTTLFLGRPVANCGETWRIGIIRGGTRNGSDPSLSGKRKEGDRANGLE